MQKTDKMVNFHDGGQVFSLRSSCVCLRKDEVLLFYYPKVDLWSLPGGRCNLLEDTLMAVKREFVEEMGEEINVQRLLWVVENFFNMKGENYHELLFIYLAELRNNSKIVQKDEFYAIEGEVQMPCKWVKIKDLGKYNLLPKFLIEKLANIPDTIEHIVNVDE